MSDKAGIYTSKDGTLYNATIQDIIDDLRIYRGREATKRALYASRVEENAHLTIDAATALLTTAVVDYTPATNSNTHDEFRHLLATAGQYVAAIIRATVIAEITVAFAAGLMGRIAGQVPDSALIAVAIVNYSLHLADGIRQLAQRPGGPDFITATICNAFLAWMREAALVFAGEYLPHAEPALPPNGVLKGNVNRTEGTLLDVSMWPMSLSVVRKAMESLGEVEAPAARFVSLAAVTGGLACDGT